MDIILTDRLLFDTLFCSVILLFIAILLERFFDKENRALNILDVINFLLIIVVGTTLGFFAVTYRQSSNALHFTIPCKFLIYIGIPVGICLHLFIGAFVISQCMKAMDKYLREYWLKHEQVLINLGIVFYPVVLICVMVHYTIQMFFNIVRHLSDE